MASRSGPDSTASWALLAVATIMGSLCADGAATIYYDA